MDFHIISTHQQNKDDTTPLQLVSAAQVAYWKKIEANYLELLEKPADLVGPSSLRR
jgi:hypothetical protein